MRRWLSVLVPMIRGLMVVHCLGHTRILMTGPHSREDFSNTSAKLGRFIIRSFQKHMTSGVVSYAGFDQQMLPEDLHHDRCCCCMATTTRVCRQQILEFLLKRTAQPICKLSLVPVTDFVTTQERSQFCLDG